RAAPRRRSARQRSLRMRARRRNAWTDLTALNIRCLAPVMHVTPGPGGGGYVFRMAASPSAPGAEYPPPPPLVTLLALTMGVFLVTLNVTVVTVALPDIQQSLNA